MTRFAGVIGALVAGVATACSIGALDGFSGAPAEADGGPTDSGKPEDTGSAADGSVELVSGPSCNAIKQANPGAKDGRYRIVPPAEVAPPFEADCDMTQDGGGWMRVSDAMIVEEKAQSVTSFKTSDENNRFMLRVYANSRGCGEGPENGYFAIVRDAPRWTQLRARYDFYGRSSCWDMLGATSSGVPFVPNIIPFEKSIDVAREMVKMGGSLGDAFDGDPNRCDDEPTNFWAGTSDDGRRSMVAIVRRNSPDIPAGLYTAASCTETAPGATSPTFWEYRDIYVR